LLDMKRRKLMASIEDHLERALRYLGYEGANIDMARNEVECALHHYGVEQTTSKKCQTAVSIGREFVDDVDAVGVKELEETWPDLAVSYRKMKGVLTYA